MGKPQKVTSTAQIVLTLSGMAFVLCAITMGFIFKSEGEFKQKVIGLQGEPLSELQSSFEYLHEGDKEFCLKHSDKTLKYSGCYAASGLSSYAVFFVKDDIVVYSSVFGT